MSAITETKPRIPPPPPKLAATKIQALHRGGISRHAVELKKVSLNGPLRQGSLEGFVPPPPPSRQASKTIQSAQRGRITRKAIKECKKQLGKIQPGCLVGMEITTPSRSAAISIQANMRGHLNRIGYVSKAVQEGNIHESCARYLDDPKDPEEWKEKHSAAVKIQARQRGKSQRNRKTVLPAGWVDRIEKEDTTLEVINMNSYPVATSMSKLLSTSISFNGSLHKLLLENCQISDRQAKILSEGLEKNRGITELNLANNSIGDNGAVAIAESITHNEQLLVLDMTGNIIKDTGANRLALTLTENNHLKFLSLSYNNIKDDGCKAIAEALRLNSSLKTLHLSDNYIEEPGAEALAEVLSKNSASGSIALFTLDSHTAKKLANNLKTNNSLEVLDIAGNNIKSVGASAIGDALRTNTSLLELDLQDNSIKHKGICDLFSGLKHNSRISSLDISGNFAGELGTKAMTDALKYSKTLKRLYANACDINPAGAFQLASALTQNKTLQLLHISHNNIGNNGASSISDVICIGENETLMDLNISGCRIGIANAKTISSELLVVSTKITIDVSDNGLTGCRNIRQHIRKVDAAKAAHNKRLSDLKIIHRKNQENKVSLSANGRVSTTSLDEEDRENSAATVIQKHERARQARGEVSVLLEKNRAAVLLQAQARGRLSRNLKLRKNVSVIEIQKNVRGMLTRKICRKIAADLAYYQANRILNRKIAKRKDDGSIKDLGDPILAEARFYASKTMRQKDRDVKEAAWRGYNNSNNFKAYWEEQLNNMIKKEQSNSISGVEWRRLKKVVFAIKTKVPGSTLEEILCAIADTEGEGIFREYSIVEKLLDPYFQLELDLAIKLIDVRSYANQLGLLDNGGLSYMLKGSIGLSNLQQIRPITQFRWKNGQKKLEKIQNVNSLKNLAQHPLQTRFTQNYARALPSLALVKPVTSHTKERLGVTNNSSVRAADLLIDTLVNHKSFRDAKSFIHQQSPRGCRVRKSVRKKKDKRTRKMSSALGSTIHNKARSVGGCQDESSVHVYGKTNYMKKFHKNHSENRLRKYGAPPENNYHVSDARKRVRQTKFYIHSKSNGFPRVNNEMKNIDKDNIDFLPAAYEDASPVKFHTRVKDQTVSTYVYYFQFRFFFSYESFYLTKILNVKYFSKYIFSRIDSPSFWEQRNMRRLGLYSIPK